MLGGALVRSPRLAFSALAQICAAAVHGAWEGFCGMALRPSPQDPYRRAIPTYGQIVSATSIRKEVGGKPSDGSSATAGRRRPQTAVVSLPTIVPTLASWRRHGRGSGLTVRAAPENHACYTARIASKRLPIASRRSGRRRRDFAAATPCGTLPGLRADGLTV